MGIKNRNVGWISYTKIVQNKIELVFILRIYDFHSCEKQKTKNK